VSITSKPKTIGELARAYGVSVPTFRKWLKCEQLKHILKEKDGNYIQIPHLRQIVKHLDRD